MEKRVSPRKKPIIGLTMGDPAGVGPEITVKALFTPRVRTLCRPVVIGRKSILMSAARSCRLPASFQVVSDPAEKVPQGVFPLIETGGATSGVRTGRPGAAGGRMALAAIEKAAGLAVSGKIKAMVTAPISKEAIRKAGSPFPGHTEMLASLTGSRRFAMMLVGGGLRVSLATIHVPLRDVPRILTSRSITTIIDLTWEAMKDFKASATSIAVCGLNPHAGEGGIMGDEDKRLIAPAVRACAKKGVPVSGPWPADTVFYRSLGGEFGAVVAMYHDQGLIPLKTLAFDTGVNLTLGLPIIRTSVDHGTAYDIAGRGKASPASMISAVGVAAELAGNRYARQ